MHNTKLTENVEIVGGREFKAIYSLHQSVRAQTTRVDYRIDGARVSKADWQKQKQAAQGAVGVESSIKATLTVYRFQGDYAVVAKKVELDAPKAALLETLAAMRVGLPSDHGATLSDACGRDIRP